MLKAIYLKMAFRTTYEDYESVVKYFGLTSTTSTFVKLIDFVLCPIIGKSVVSYLNNITAFSNFKA